jgi:hypothetical protein
MKTDVRMAATSASPRRRGAPDACIRNSFCVQLWVDPDKSRLFTYPKNIHLKIMKRQSLTHRWLQNLFFRGRG